MRWIKLGMVAREMKRSTGPGTPSWGERLSALPRWGASIGTGAYHGTAPGRLIRMILATLYVVTPIDLMPEGFFALFGLTDDAIVIAWLVTAVSQETRSFLEWERAATGPQDRVRHTDQWTAPPSWDPPGGLAPYVPPRPASSLRTMPPAHASPAAAAPAAPSAAPRLPVAPPVPAAAPPSSAPWPPPAPWPSPAPWTSPAPWQGPHRSWLDPTDDTTGPDRIR